MEQLIKLCEKFNCKYLQNEKMSLHTTFKIGGNARLVVYVQNEEQISEFVKCAKAENVRLIAVGNGSNLLVDDDGIDACVLILGEPFSQIELIDDETIYAKAGAKLIALCRFAYEHSLSGLEFAYGIPGSVGGAVYMNAGAYGGEISEVLESCLCFDTAKLTETKFDRDECDFGYRSSLFIKNPGRYILLQATFALSSGNADEIKAAMNDYMSRRREKQPLEYPSAGSVFKRAPGYFTAKLIDDAGLKGKRIGGAQISEKHAGFIVNIGNATAKDVIALIALTKETVHEKFNVDIECEIRFLGDSEKQ